jgi:hypothetical protein
MTDDEYTPTTDEVRDRASAQAGYTSGMVEAMTAEFDRWLAAHDAEVAAKALRALADNLGVNVGDDDSEWWQGYRQAQREFVHGVAERADRIRGGAS